MLRLTDVTLTRGGDTILSSVNLTLFPGHKIGLVGRNGAGKTSLAKLILDELHADKGEVSRPPAWVVTTVEQEIHVTDQPAIEFVLDGQKKLRAIERAIESGDLQGVELAEAHAAYEHLGGYSARARAGEILDGLGFPPAEHQKAVKDFSGGVRMRLALARALAETSDLLLLDEPTNHLDLDAVLWLEGWLQRYPGMLIVITHDRDFLDAVAEHIVHLQDGRATQYRGNYSAFEEQLALRVEQSVAAKARQDQKITHLTRFIERFRYKATKAKQAQSRIKQLEKIERVAVLRAETPITFSFREPIDKPKLLFSIDEAAIGYGDKRVLSNVKFSCWYGDRIGLLGANGAGKSTLLKSIVGELPPQTGTLSRAEKLRIGYFNQHTVDALDLDRSSLAHMTRLDGAAREQELRDYLGRFDIGGKDAERPVASFSGGEKARLALALIIYQRPNLLLLDEPTNHLDLATREQLAIALQEFDGGLMIVAHDRHLLRAAVDTFLIVADGRVGEYEGDLDDYKTYVLSRKRGGAIVTSPFAADASKMVPAPAAESNASRQDKKREEAKLRQALADARKPVEARLTRIDREMDKLNAEKSQLEAWLASPAATAADARDQLKEAMYRSAEISAQLAKLEEEWLEKHQELEDIKKRLVGESIA